MVFATDSGASQGVNGHPPGIILAAARHGADSSAPPPPELELKRYCLEYHALPCAGGLLDQPAGLLRRMDELYAVAAAFALYAQGGQRAGQMAAWAKAHPIENRIVNRVKALERKLKHGY